MPLQMNPRMSVMQIMLGAGMGGLEYSMARQRTLWPEPTASGTGQDAKTVEYAMEVKSTACATIMSTMSRAGAQHGPSKDPLARASRPSLATLVHSDLCEVRFRYFGPQERTLHFCSCL